MIQTSEQDVVAIVQGQSLRLPGLMVRYVVSIALVVLAVAVRAAFSPMLGQQTVYLPLLIAVVISSWFGGIGPGIVTATCGILASMILQQYAPEPTTSRLVAEYLSLAFFTAACIAIVLITESYRTAHRGTHLALRQLLEKSQALEAEVVHRQEVERALRHREQELIDQARDLEEVRRQTANSLAILDAFLHHAPLGMFFLNNDREFLFANQHLCELVRGQPPLDQSSDPSLLLESLPSEIQQTVDDVYVLGKSVLGRTIVLGESNSTSDNRAWTFGLFPVRIPGRDVIGVGGVLQEITERLRAEAQLKESEWRFRLLAETLPQLVWATDPRGKVYYFNQRWYRFTGLSESDSIGDKWSQVLHPEDQERCLYIWNHAVETESSYEIEYRFRAANGEYRWFLGRGLPLRNEVGAIVTWFGTCTDIHELKQIQWALRESQERFRLLSETIPQIVWTANAAGHVNYLNQRWLEYTGLGLGESQGEGWMDVLHPEERDRRRRSWQEARNQGLPFQIEQRLRRAEDGAYRWHLVRGVPLHTHDGQISQWVGSMTDVDDQHRQSELLERLVEERTRALERSNRELDQFASVASHDLQEPLRKIQAFGYRLQSVCGDRLDERGEEYLGRILTSTARLRKLIDDILQYSRVTRNSQPFQSVDLNQILGEVVSDLESLIQATDGRVVVHRLPVLQADASQMRQLFLNLVGNALKFQRPGKPAVVDISARALDVSGRRMIEIQVTDNGIGFEEEYRERIFKLFERLHGRIEYDGSGMGLAICRKIVERHGGQIRAEGRPEEGSTFIVELPVSLEPSIESDGG